MSYTYDPTTAIGLVRLRINDRVAPYTYTDEEIQAFINAESNSYGASAAALEAIIVRSGSLAKSISVMQLKYDNSRGIDALLKLAQFYRDQAAIADAATGGNFDYAEFVDDQFAARERMFKEFERETA